MKITVTIDQPTGDFQDRLLALLAEYAETVELDATWTVARAESYYRTLPARARRIVREAATRNGYVSADDLRDTEDSSLRGHSAALSRALNRGSMRGEWPEGMRAPIEAQGPGFGKVVGYRMPDELVPVFQAAVSNTEKSGPYDRHDTAGAMDSFHALTDAFNKPIRKHGAPTEK